MKDIVVAIRSVTSIICITMCFLCCASAAFYYVFAQKFMLMFMYSLKGKRINEIEIVNVAKLMDL